MSSDIAIKLDDVSKCYQIYDTPRDRLKQSVFPRLQKIINRPVGTYHREFWALKDISFEIKKGETVGIIGKNGAGKSTLLQILCGTLTPTTGSIQVNGRIAALLELGAGFNPEFTGRENVYMNATILGLSVQEIDARYADIIAFADIGDFIEQPVKTYSSGMYVRLAFAVIAHVDADILIVDEALSVGDAVFTQKCMRYIQEFQKKGALIFVSHDLNAVTAVCDRAIWLDKGKIRAIDKTKNICELYTNYIYSEIDRPTEKNPNENPVNDRQIALNRINGDMSLWIDQRAQLINSSNHRNDLEIFKFSVDASNEYGGVAARISDVWLQDSEGRKLNWIVGGEKVILHISAYIMQKLEKPIVGFAVKDKLGQWLFGDNTYISYSDNSQSVLPGEHLVAEFEFIMPWLPKGDYSIKVALADGTQNDHQHIHWIHDALFFKSLYSPTHTGIIGIPMIDIRLRSV